MTFRSLAVLGWAALGNVAQASPPADAPATAAAPAPVAYAVLKAPLPPEAPGPCATTAIDAQHLRAMLVSAETRGCPVARVGGEVIALEELSGALAMSHGARAESDALGAPKAVSTNLDGAMTRILDVHLLVQEAREMGMTDLPDVRKAIDDFDASSARALLERRATREIGPDAAEVERLFRDAVREWRLESLLFPREPDATRFRARLAKGEPFAGAAAKALADKSGQGSAEPEWVQKASLVPEIRAAVAKLERGRVTPPIAVKGGFVVARLGEVRYPESAEARSRARQASLELRRKVALEKYHRSLVKKHAAVDRALLARLDFEARKPGFEALRKDRRVLARIAGAEPITIADLASGLAGKFFHGLERPIAERRVNPHKVEVFDAMLRGRVVEREVAAQRLREAPEHRKAVDEYSSAVLFSTFIEKVLVPDVKVSDPEAQRYYDEHQGDFTQPQMYKLGGLAFGSPRLAQAALEKLRAGTDLAFLRANADGQLKPEDRKVDLEGGTVSAATLAPALAKALTGARKGDDRLYSDGAQHYVLHVLEEYPATPQPYPQAREAVARKLFTERLGKAVHGYAEQLRKARPVEVFITRIENGS